MGSGEEDETIPEELLAEYLSSLEATGDASLVELCAAHPERGDELRRVWAEHRRALRALARGGVPGPADDHPSLAVGPGTHIGNFTLVELIGEGGMGMVWRAEQRSLNRTVALKIVRPERVSPKALDMFAREARAGGRLNHPGLVAVHAHGEDSGVAWIAMEYVEGAYTLRDFIDRGARADELSARYYTDVARLVEQVTDALHAAHEAGVIHRDLKPQNVLVTPDDLPKVTDFGLARITDETPLSMTGEVAGTYYYMSPEQISAKRIDHRTDVFSLGVVLYELLTLRRPFEGDTTHQVAHRILSDDPTPPRAIRSRIPADLAVIAGKCLEKERDRRYTTMGELAADLRRYLESEPILARPPSRARRLRLWVRRNPTRSVAGLLIVAATAVVSLLLAANVRSRSSLERRMQEVERLSALQNYEDLVLRARELWPPHPRLIPTFEKWIADATQLVDALPDHRSARREEVWRARALSSIDPAGLLEGKALSSEEEVEFRWWNNQLNKLIGSLEQMTDPNVGLLSAGISPDEGWGMRKRLSFARLLRDEFAPGGAWSEQWSKAIEAIQHHPKYQGLKLAPQEGLVPIGPDPGSGLWEFWHVATGEEPSRGADGRLIPQEEMGLVLVLIPGTETWMGAQATDPASRNHDDLANADEGPAQVSLSAYFLSKYEMTQEQWERITGRNPSQHRPPDDRHGPPMEPLRQSGRLREGSAMATSLLHPVEQVSWEDCMRELQRMGLSLPSEAQWENACRAETETPWWPGHEPQDLRGAANLADESARLANAPSVWPFAAWLVDGFAVHAPVNSYEANAFGLHNVHGNVWEWCLDGYDPGFLDQGPMTDPVAPWADASQVVYRGGGFDSAPVQARAAFRECQTPSYVDSALGVRPARRVEP